MAWNTDATETLDPSDNESEKDPAETDETEEVEDPYKIAAQIAEEIEVIIQEEGF